MRQFMGAVTERLAIKCESRTQVVSVWSQLLLQYFFSFTFLSGVISQGIDGLLIVLKGKLKL